MLGTSETIDEYHPLIGNEKMKNEGKKPTLLLVGGMVLIVIGTGFFVAGFVGFTRFSPLCAITCPSIFSSNYTIFWSEMFVGLVFIISGIGMVITSRRVKVVESLLEPPKADLQEN